MNEDTFLDEVEALCEKGQESKPRTARNYLNSIKKRVQERRKEKQEKREKVRKRGSEE